ncbi:MAG: hypothetical protein MJ007_02915 [Paludibacteraceae bacterium]|nr:hypothetical protein [Paludibacteraceae bacterium]
MKPLYYCDPDKNKQCPKITGDTYGCFKTCFFTTKLEAKADDNNIRPEQALASLEYMNSNINRVEYGVEI